MVSSLAGKSLLVVLILLLFGAAAAGCAAPSAGVPPIGAPAGAPTAIVVRMLDLDAQPAFTPTALPTFTPAPTLPPPTLAAGLAPAGSATPASGLPAAEALEASPTPACLNRAEFVRHLSVNDNVALKGGELIAKVWQVRNAGDCIWSALYRLVPVAGETFGVEPVAPFTTEVKPGDTADLRVSILTPEQPGPYAGDWMLQDPQGNNFGVGEDGAQPLQIKINVQPPARPTPS